MTTPTVGRIVHYYQDDDREDAEAAIISRVCEDVENGPGHVDLVVLSVQRLQGRIARRRWLVAHVLAVPYLERVPEAEGGPTTFWTWPPRVGGGA